MIAAIIFSILFVTLIWLWLGFVVTIILCDMEAFLNCKNKFLFLLLWPISNICSILKINCKNKRKKI
jgi:hypothetical protein